MHMSIRDVTTEKFRCEHNQTSHPCVIYQNTLLLVPFLIWSKVPKSNELVPIIVQTLSIGTRGPALCVNAYCQFSQQVRTNSMQTYLHWLMLTCFFIGFPSIFIYENKSIALWHLALFPLSHK